MESVFKAFQNAFGFKKEKKITLGICAMEKKANSKPMKELLKRLPNELFEVIIFGDECILNVPIEKWPIVDCLIAFFSKGFPTEKAMDYVKLRKPYEINDLRMEAVLKDRRQVYKMLQSLDISVPNYVILNRDDPNVVNVVEEYDEYIVINGTTLKKPLVEKPADAEDHNIYIYYPMSAGGGSKRLFRKVDNKSSDFFPTVNELRTEGSFIYEEFLTTQGTDVKVYTVGPDYAHAEARKSPVVDGKVNRDISGYEIRYPVILNALEKDYARRIVEGFRQTVCGFDILRVPGKSYVCDVNGFSFVKNSKKYYDDASQVLVEMLLTQLRPQLLKVPSTRAPLLRIQSDDRAASPTLEDSSSHSVRKSKEDHEPEELRCVIAVIRHGDRTPKQKMKIKISVPKYLDYFHSYAKPDKDLKVKSKSALVKFLNVTREIINEHSDTIEESLFRKLRQMRDVLERWEISGINRKLQMKPQKWEYDAENPNKILRATEVLLILKWGGDLTPLGKDQAEIVGTQFRHQMYPDHSGGVLRLHSTYRHDLKIKASDEGRVMKTAAAFAKGLLELEGQLTPILVSLVEIEEKNRQMLDRNGNTAVADDIERCKNHLNLLQETTDMTEEIVQLIAPDCPASVKAAMLKLKSPRGALMRIYELIGEFCEILGGFKNILPASINGSGDNLDSISQTGVPIDELPERAPTPLSVQSSENDITYNNLEAARKFSHSYAPMTKSISSESLNQSFGDGLYLSETYELMCDRWEKLHKDFYNQSTGVFDLSKVPDVYDMIRYDCLHNGHLNLKVMEDLYELSATLENIIVPQEYGTDKVDKLVIGSKMCGALLEKIKGDLEASHADLRVDNHFMLDHSHAAEIGVNTLGRHVRTRLYFTSESHIHTLLNELRYPGPGKLCAISPEGQEFLDNIPELCYLTQVVFRMYEDRADPTKFRCEISLSPGANNSPWTGKKNEIAPMISLNKSISYDDLIQCLNDAISAGGETLAKTYRSDSIVGNGGLDTPSNRGDSSPGKKTSKTTVVSNGALDASDNWETHFKNSKDRAHSLDKGKDKDKSEKKERRCTLGDISALTPNPNTPVMSAEAPAALGTLSVSTNGESNKPSTIAEEASTDSS